MRPIHVLTIVAFALSGTPAASFDAFRPDTWFAPDSCSPEIPGIRILTAPARVTLDHSGNQQEIDTRARTLTMAVRDGWVTNGLATANLLTSGEMVTKEYRLSDGSWCVTLSSAEIVVRYEDPIRVMVSREYPAGSCPYRVITEHEAQHVAIYRDVLERHLSGAQGRMVEKIRLAGPVVAPTLAEAKDRIDSRVNAAIEELADGITTEARTRNAALDTPENYLKIQSMCRDW